MMALMAYYKLKRAQTMKYETPFWEKLLATETVYNLTILRISVMGEIIICSYTENSLLLKWQ